MKRPGSVTFIAALLVVAAAFNVVFGIWMMISAPAITDIAGNGYEVPTFWLFMNGLLSAVLGIMYLWLARITLAGSETALVLIQFLAVLNIVFGFFRLPYGWGIILLSVLILIMVSSAQSKAWFSQTR